jgi:hypothetical protein
MTLASHIKLGAAARSLENAVDLLGEMDAESRRECQELLGLDPEHYIRGMAQDLRTCQTLLRTPQIDRHFAPAIPARFESNVASVAVKKGLAL